MSNASKKPHIISRNKHDLARARDLIMVIADRLADEGAFAKNGGEEMTPELHDYLIELNDIAERYAPLSVELDDE